MNTPGNKNKCFFYSLLLCGCFLFLNTSCGLDQYVYVDSPYYTNHEPAVEKNSLSDYDTSYFDFYTNENGMKEFISGSSDFIFIGTEVYYKIYNSYDKMNSDKNSLYSLSVNNEYAAAEKLINTTSAGGYQYLPLRVEGYNESVLVPATGTNRRVYIRLTDYLSEAAYAAKVTLNNTPIGGTSVPKRNMQVGGYSFNFGRKNKGNTQEYKVPEKDEADVYYDSSITNNGKWYVSLYAVAIGRNSDYSMSYSNICYLGTVCIDANSEDN